MLPDISAVATGLSTNSALGTLAGFAAFPLVDPVIIADLNNDGLVDSSDVTLLNSVLAGIPRAQIPTIPTGLTIVRNCRPTKRDGSQSHKRLRVGQHNGNHQWFGIHRRHGGRLRPRQRGGCRLS